MLPVKALIMNLLTLSAAFGILKLIFQDGRLEGLLGYTSQGALESSQPILLFAIAFGLSTDYGVFLLTRIKEARDGGLPNDEAVAVGLQRTGRIVTAAAILFCIAIGAFVTSEMIFIKQLGLGHRARRADRRDDRARAARAVADEAARRVELVGAAAAGAAARADRAARGAGVTLAPPHAFDADTALERARRRPLARVGARALVRRAAARTAATSPRSPRARRRGAAGRPLRSLALHFVAAPAVGPLDVAVDARARGPLVLRASPSGSSRTGAPMTLALATLGELPEDGAAWDAAPTPDARRSPRREPVPPGAAPNVPAFMRNYDMRWALGRPDGRRPRLGRLDADRASRARSTRRSSPR